MAAAAATTTAKVTSTNRLTGIPDWLANAPRPLEIVVVATRITDAIEWIGRETRQDLHETMHYLIADVLHDRQTMTVDRGTHAAVLTSAQHLLVPSPVRVCTCRAIACAHVIVVLYRFDATLDEDELECEMGHVRGSCHVLADEIDVCASVLFVRALPHYTRGGDGDNDGARQRCPTDLPMDGLRAFMRDTMDLFVAAGKPATFEFIDACQSHSDYAEHVLSLDRVWNKVCSRQRFVTAAQLATMRATARQMHLQYGASGDGDDDDDDDAAVAGVSAAGAGDDDTNDADTRALLAANTRANTRQPSYPWLRRATGRGCCVVC